MLSATTHFSTRRKVGKNDERNCKEKKEKRREENEWMERYVIFTSNHGMICHVTSWYDDILHHMPCWYVILRCDVSWCDMTCHTTSRHLITWLFHCIILQNGDAKNWHVSILEMFFMCWIVFRLFINRNTY